MGNDKEFAFFLGCIMPNRYPQIEKSTKFVMEKLGYKLLDMERAACCPAPGVLRSFDKFDWMVAGARNLCIAEKMEKDVLTCCNGCFGTLKDINVHLKNDEDARAKVNAKLKLLGDYEFKGTITVRHIAEFLTVEIGPTEIQDYLIRKINAKVAIHYGCHFLKPTSIRGIESSESPIILEDYAEALGLESLEFKNKLTCCGAGGGIKAAFAESSMTILGEKMKNIDEVKPDFILDTCPFCHLQFETGQEYLNKNHNANYDYPVIHISQLTAYCMGMDQNFIGLQYQSMGKNYIFGSEEVKSND
ncbi:MAG: CoB--CoM heterodisulfide reductase subunit B [archaeon]|nr:CoB--CoM heterodisulfide reductase subunit B [archaeon]